MRVRAASGRCGRCQGRVGGENQAAGPGSWGRRPAVGGQGAGPGGQPGGVRPLGRTVGPVAPDPAAKTGNSRRAGGCGPCPVDNLWPHGLMASSPRGIVASVSLRRRCPSWNGEPPYAPTPWSRFWVYPRACGATKAESTREPAPERVYPRACGGTPAVAKPTTQPGGLSPRLRGNHLASARSHVAVRSIPAPAREPVQEIDDLPAFQVYPRACGGTIRGSENGRSRSGLSPRLRV